MKKIDFIIDIVNRILELICHCILSLIVILTVSQVFARYLFNKPSSWVPTLSLILLIWYGSIITGTAVRYHGHIAILAIRDNLPQKAATVLDFISQVLIFVFSVVLLIYSPAIIATVSTQEVPALGISRAWVYYPLIVMSALAGFNSFFNLIYGRLVEVEREIL